MPNAATEAAKRVSVRSCAPLRLEILEMQIHALGNSGQHAGTDPIVVVKSEHCIDSAIVSKSFMRLGPALHDSANANQRRRALDALPFYAIRHA